MKKMYVKRKYDWTEWIQPRRKYYYLRCCDCGLTHKMEFKLIKPRNHIIFRAKRIKKT